MLQRLPESVNKQANMPSWPACRHGRAGRSTEQHNPDKGRLTRYSLDCSRVAAFLEAHCTAQPRAGRLDTAMILQVTALMSYALSTVPE